jgi:hypothetical protein
MALLDLHDEISAACDNARFAVIRSKQLERLTDRGR